MRVPMREIAVSGGEPALRVYDASGPQGIDPRQGLPELRRAWVLERAVTESGVASAAAGLARGRTRLRGRGPVTQLHCARKHEITPEMEFIAIREGFEAEFVRSEVARGRAIIPAKITPSSSRW
jgi:phosphomethylpyrimidine synthase